MLRYDHKFGHCRYGLEGKELLESLLKAHPEDRDLLNEYFEFLSELSKRSIGIMHALLPGVTHPLYFRCNTSDILNMILVLIVAMRPSFCQEGFPRLAYLVSSLVAKISRFSAQIHYPTKIYERSMPRCGATLLG
jgi:hypothetical protein